MPKKTEPKSAAAIAPTLLLSGDYKGLAHRRVGRMMYYVIKLQVEHELNTADVKSALLGVSRITYRVPAAASNETVLLDGTVESAMPDNGDEIWLDDRRPHRVNFTIHHPAAPINPDNVASLLQMLNAIDLQLVASIVPLQRRLL